MQHLQYIDRMKGFAMLSVIVGHIVFYCMYGDWDKASTNPFLASVNHYQMPLFMFLSGWVITEIPSIGKLKHKLLRFLLPFFLVGSAYIFFLGTYSFEWLVDGFKAGYWYLWVLSFYYIILTMARPLLHSGGIAKLLLVAIVVFAILRIILIFVPAFWANLISFNLIEAMWPYFIAGVIFRHCKRLDSLTDNNNFMSLCWLLSFCLYLLFTKVGMGHGYQCLNLCLALSFFCLFRRYNNSSSHASNFLAFIGRHSLDVYVFHYFFLKILNLLPFGVWISQTRNYLVEGIVIIPLAVIIALLAIGVGGIIRQSRAFRLIVFGEK